MNINNFIFIFLMCTVFFTASLEALNCVVMNAVSDPDGDGFYSSTSKVGNVLPLPTGDYCPPEVPAIGRLIDLSNREMNSCQEINTFRTNHIRGYDQSNALAPDWLTLSHPGKEEVSLGANTYDDDCDGMVNEFSFAYYHELMGRRQVGEGAFMVTLNINEPMLQVPNSYDIVFDVYELGQLTNVYELGPYGEKIPLQDPGVTPILSKRVPLSGGYILETTITGLENKNQVYAVKARAMTRGVSSVQIRGFDYTNGSVVVDPNLLINRENDVLHSHYYFIFVSEYVNGQSTSPIRNTIVNNAFWYKHLADTGTLSRQKNYDDTEDNGFYVDYTNGDYFAYDWAQWCSEFVASTYFNADSNIRISTLDNLENSNMSLGVDNMAEWFAHRQTKQHRSANQTNPEQPIQDNLLAFPQVNSAGLYIPTTFIDNDDFFDIAHLQPGDYVMMNNFNHSTIFLGITADPDYFFTIEGNADESTTRGNTVGIGVHQTSEIRSLGALPY